MNEAQFWEIIRQTLHAKTQDEQWQLLLDSLYQLSLTDVRDFSSMFWDMHLPLLEGDQLTPLRQLLYEHYDWDDFE